MAHIITLGETMLRLSPPDGRRLEQATSLEVEVGGSESNTAIGLARLGLSVCWLSCLPATPLGRMVARSIAAQGVDTSAVVWNRGGRLGVYFYEQGSSPRSGQVIYDRVGSAMSRMQPSDLPTAPFHDADARLLHLSGITPALSADAAATALRAVALAQQAGLAMSFDLNYRAALWSPAAARAGYAPFLAAASLVVAPLADLATLYGAPGDDPEAALDLLAAQAPAATVVLTMGEHGAIARAPGEQPCHQPAFPTTASLGRLGRGDAFMAGFLFGTITANDPSESLQRGLAWGTATAAIKATIPGDAPLLDRAEVEALLARPESGPQPGIAR